jgi:transposase-like protein
MMSDTRVHLFEHPDTIDDPLTAVLRDGARRLLARAIEAEAEAFLATMRGERLEDGRARVVRHGHGPERVIQTGIGPVPVRRPKVRDRGAGEAAEAGGERIAFTSAILPRWARRTRSLDALLPVLYLRGVSTGDFGEALSALLGCDAPNLSPSVIGRLKADWEADYDRWQRRDLSARRYVYVWADGVYLQARMGEAGGPNAAECMLVIIGATPEGKKELVGFQVGVRESARDAGASCSWTSRREASLSRPRSPWATGPWGSGGRSTRCSPARVTRGAGNTRRRTCSTKSRARYSRP